MGIFFLRFTRFASRAPQRIRTRIRTSRTDDQNAHMSRFDELLYSSGERTRAFIAPYRSRDLPLPPSVQRPVIITALAWLTTLIYSATRSPPPYVFVR